MRNKIYLTIAFLFILETSAVAQWTNIWTNNYIYSSCFATGPDICFVSGTSGEIYRTLDGGITWDSVQTIFTTSWFNDIYFPSPNTGYVCGGTAFGMHTSIIAKTTDGGQTWDSLTSNFFGYDFTKVVCVNDSVAFFCGDQFVRTTDGGLTFSVITYPFIARVTAAFFFSDSSGLIATDEHVTGSKRRYRIAATTDGGINWTTNYLDSTDNFTMPGFKRINEIKFRNATAGYAVADNGIYLTSSNGGLSWSAIQGLNDSSSFEDIAMSKTSGVGYITSRKYSASTGFLSRIYKTVDSGLTWQENFSDSLQGFFSISMATDDTVYAAGYGNIFKTTNGGAAFIHENVNEEQHLALFPNPASGEFRIQNAESMSDLEIYDILGQKVFFKHKLNMKEVVIDVSKWNPGIYLVKINDAKMQRSRKFVVL